MSDPSQPSPPEVPPVPRYGEYAPAGYVPPAPAEPAPPVAYPQYGYPMHPAPGVRRRKTWDLVLTIVLLVMGFFGMLIGLLYAGIISDPALMDQLFQQQNLGDFDGTVGAAPAVIVASHVILYLAVLGGSIPLLISKRVAFWLPLAAGVIAAIIFWSALGGVFLSDPDFLSAYS